MNVTQIVVPRGAFGLGGDDTPLEFAIRLIAEAFKEPGEWAEKYGATVDNDLFSMNPFCWCDSEECPWCGHAAPNFLWKPTGGTVRWYKYIGRSMEVSGEFPVDMIEQALSAHPQRPTASDVVARVEAEAEAAAKEFADWLGRGAPEDEVFG